MSLRIAVVEPGKEPYLKDIEATKTGEREESYLDAYQAEVGGLIEYFGVLFGDNPALYINEESLINGSTPNRAVYANDRMAQVGYISQMDYRTVVKPGDLYAVLIRYEYKNGEIVDRATLYDPWNY